MPELY